MQTTALLDSSSSETEYSTPVRKVNPLAWLDSSIASKRAEIDNLLMNPPASPLCGVVGGMGLLPVRNLRQDIFDSHNDLASTCRSGSEYLFKKDLIVTRRQLSSDLEYRSQYMTEYVKPSSVSSGFKISRYKSGEIVGGFFTSGLSGKVLPPTRTGQLVTRRFTRSSLVKLRRSVECSEALNYFHTLTFAPSVLQRWHLNDDGTVRHDYAKWKLKKYLDALSQQQRRLGRSLSYTWVAELQKNGNIHFHILLDRFFGITWLTKIWSQSNNSVDIERVKNPLHAAQYMRKYITKDQESEIMGNRYYISQKLRDSMQPVNDALIVIRDSSGRDRQGVMADIRDFLFSSKTEIEVNGGVLLDFGFYVPMPRQSVRYRDKKTGEFVASKAVSPLISKKLFTALYQIADRPF